MNADEILRAVREARSAGDFKKATRLARRLRGVSTTPIQQILALLIDAAADVDAGRWREAVLDLDVAVDVARRHRLDRALASVLDERGVAMIADGRAEAGVRDCLASAQHLRELSLAGGVAEALVHAASAVVETYEQRSAWLKAALNAAEKMGSGLLAGDVHEALGRLLSERQLWEQSWYHYAEARRQFLRAEDCVREAENVVQFMSALRRGDPAWQRFPAGDRLADRLNIKLVPPVSHSLMAISWLFNPAVPPFVGTRGDPKHKSSGWHLWSGDPHDDSRLDRHNLVHAHHLVDALPEIAPYLALPSGYSFAIAPGTEQLDRP